MTIKEVSQGPKLLITLSRRIRYHVSSGKALVGAVLE